MRIAQSLIDEMVAHAIEDLPNECCGMVGGSNGEASVVIPVANAAASPLRFEMDPQGQYDALKQIEEGGGEMLAIYHSHTKSAAYPSQTDVNQAVSWPDAIWVIVSLEEPDAPDVKGYWLEDLKIADAEPSSSSGGRPVKVAYALNQMEAEMIQGLLAEHGIPSMVQRTVDNPEFLAAGPRQILVPEAAAEEAREVLEGAPGTD